MVTHFARSLALAQETIHKPALSHKSNRATTKCPPTTSQASMCVCVSKVDPQTWMFAFSFWFPLQTALNMEYQLKIHRKQEEQKQRTDSLIPHSCQVFLSPRRFKNNTPCPAPIRSRPKPNASTRAQNARGSPRTEAEAIRDKPKNELDLAEQLEKLLAVAQAGQSALRWGRRGRGPSPSDLFFLAGETWSHVLKRLILTFCWRWVKNWYPKNIVRSWLSAWCREA